MLSTCRRPAWAVVVAALFTTPSAPGQTFTWTANTAGNWSSSANWAGGVVPVPGAGARLAFTRTALLTAGTENAANNDIANPFDLTFLDLNAGFGANVVGSGFAGLAITGDPLRFVQQGANLPTITQNGAAVRIATNLQFDAATTIGGAGAGHLLIDGTLSGPAGLTINRDSNGGQTILSADNSGWAGGVTLQSGILSLTNANALGTGTLTAAGGQLRMGIFVGPTGLTIANNINAVSDFRFAGNSSGVLTGVISGAGGVVNEAALGITLRLEGANTYTGRTVAGVGPTLSGNTIVFQGNGTALNTTGIDIAPFATLQLDNSGTNLTNRLPNGVIVNSNRGTFTFTGSGTAASAESVGGLNGAGFTTVGVSAGAGQGAVVTFTDDNPLRREAGGVFFFRGVGLGQNTPFTANTPTLQFRNAGTVVAQLVGGGQSPGGASNTQISILPYAVGNITATTGNPTTFVTYDPATGVRPLAATQYASAITDGTTTADNVRLTATAAIGNPTTVNSLLLAGGGTSGAGPLTVTSGAVLVTTAGSVGNLSFPGEGIVTTVANLTANGISGTAAGLVKSGNGTLTVSTPLAVPGPLTLNQGSFVVPSFSTTPVLGTVTDVRLNGGRLTYTGATETTGRAFQLGAAGGGFEVTGGPLTLSGVLSDIAGQTGVLNKTGAGTLILTGANLYTGNTIINGGTLQVSADANLGGAGGAIALQPGGTLSVTGSFATARPLFIGGGGGDRTVSVSAGNRFTLNGTIDAPGASQNQAFPLLKAGAGTLVVGGTNNGMNGQFTVSAGTLLVNGSLAPTNYIETATTDASTGAGLRVLAGGAVGGTGLIDRQVTVASGATLTPGDPITAGGAGTLTTGRLALADGSFWSIDLRSAVARSGISPADVNTNDRVAVRGPLAFETSALTLTFDGTGQTFTVGSVYDYYIASAPTFAGFNPANISVATTNFSFDGGFSFQQLGTDLIVTFTPVPEPATVLGVAAAGLGLAGWVRRRRVRPSAA